MIPYCQHEIAEEDRAALRDVLASPRLTQGPKISAFEQALAGVTQSAAVAAVSSGTSALQISLQAMGVGRGDEVIVPSLTFLATANAVLLCGATPIFADIDRETLALDPESVAHRITPRTRGAIVVHFAGHPADVTALRNVLGPSRFLVEDACHALGATDGGRVVGAEAQAACFSFHPAKHITTGEGGAIASAAEDFVERCRRLREHGMERDSKSWTGLGLPEKYSEEGRGGWVYEMHDLAGNHRLSDLACGLGLSQLARLDENLSARRRIASRYAEAFADDARIECLEERPDMRSAWHLFPIQLNLDAVNGGREAIYRDLHAADIGVQVHYIPIHLQPFYRRHFGTRFGDLPNTEAAYLSLLSLPLFPGLAETDQQRVISVLQGALDARKR